MGPTNFLMEFHSLLEVPQARAMFYHLPPSSTFWSQAWALRLRFRFGPRPRCTLFQCRLGLGYTQPACPSYTPCCCPFLHFYLLVELPGYRTIYLKCHLNSMKVSPPPSHFILVNSHLNDHSPTQAPLSYFTWFSSYMVVMNPALGRKFHQSHP